LAADAGAEYDAGFEINLAALEPLIATPHSPGNVSTVAGLAGTPVQQVCIGSCTNSSYADLMTAAAMLEGKTVHPGVSLVVAPGSRQVLQMIADSGGLSRLVAAGARIAECACGFCIGIGHAPASGAASLRTSNRNFLGRSGTKSAGVYLASVETAAAAALAGVITDPRTLGRPPVIDVPRRFTVDDRMIIAPPADRSMVEVIRGPNIAEPPKAAPLADALKGKVAIKVGDKITTDHIMPAGSRMKYRSNPPKYAEFVFETVDATFARRAAANRDAGIDNVVVAGLSYGQGSSREHAAICPRVLGVTLVVAKSIERIHRSNLINFGIVPAAFVRAEDYDRLAEGDEVEVPGLRERIASGEDLALIDRTRGVEVPLACPLSESERKVLLAGGVLNTL